MISFAVSFVSGIFLWTFLEYVLHRFAFHERKLGKRMAREHLRHHAKPDWFASLKHKLTLAVPILSLITVVSWGLFGVAGMGVVLGTFAGWQIYEGIHRATHVRGPSNRYGEWARRHHLHHHFQNPKVNHGVTTPIWDWVFRTHERPETIRVPKRHVQAFSWLLEDPEDLEVSERYRDQYRLV